MKKAITVATMLLLLVGITAFPGCKAKEEEKQKEESVSAESGEETPTESEAEPLLGDFETVTLEGETVTQDIFAQSKLTMLNVWGTFCGPCIREMPDLGELAEEYKDRMQLVGVVSDVSEAGDDTAKEIVEKTGADYTHIVNSAEMRKGYVGEVRVVPTTVFLDDKGVQVGKTYAGAKTKEKWEAIIDQMLEQVGA